MIDNKAFFTLSYGLYVLTAMDGERPVGCIVNSAFQVTSSPATIAVSVNHDNFTNPCIGVGRAFALSVLGENADPELIGTFGFKSGRDFDKFAGLKYDMLGGLPVIGDSCAHIVCNVISSLETPTHTLFLGEVTHARTAGAAAPMTYEYYHKVIKGRAPKNAPTYVPPDAPVAKDDARYVCDLCFYEYDGDIPFADLPDTYTCPICGADKSQFVRK